MYGHRIIISVGFKNNWNFIVHLWGPLALVFTPPSNGNYLPHKDYPQEATNTPTLSQPLTLPYYYQAGDLQSPGQSYLTSRSCTNRWPEWDQEGEQKRAQMSCKTLHCQIFQSVKVKMYRTDRFHSLFPQN